MKEFSHKVLQESKTDPEPSGEDHKPRLPLPPLVRIAIYDSFTSAPRIVDLKAPGVRQLMDLLSEKAYNFSQQKGGAVPYTTIREVVENLIHANFQEVIINIYEGGNVIRISDQGPGIPDKTRVFEPGFTTARGEAKRYIRGVGSGLPIVKETMSLSGGQVTIEDNLQCGTVVTLTLLKEMKKKADNDNIGPKTASRDERVSLTRRQKMVLSLVTELEEVGPTRISEELDISLTTAYRELTFLEHAGFITSGSQGKRRVASKGLEYLKQLART
ncbi:MAG: Sensor histidine kinase DpiB [Actinobacteria bacterium]|nr:Sensor histidine kinase DpiB [Actinomycetota bacterium]